MSSTDRSERLRFHVYEFAARLGRFSADERREALTTLLDAMKLLDAAETPLTSFEQARFETDMAKPLNLRSGHFNYPDDPRCLAGRAESLLKESAELAAEAHRLIRGSATGP
jgi:hypothetical protein